jgi:histidinol dehydrogenase
MFRTVDLRNGGDPPDVLRLALEEGVLEEARAICERVRVEGDAALIDLTRRLDGADIEGRIRVSEEEMAEASDRVDPALKEALDAVAERLRDLHARQLPRSWEEEKDGVVFGEVVLPLASAGCYVPGGRGAYPSSVLMTVIPAKVAGVDRVVVCSPPAVDASLPDPVLFAAGIAGAHAVYRVGGAQAIAALAYGTETIESIDKVVGPGNVWVTAAKREVAGVVGVDALAGPTELVVVADGTADPQIVACDLVAQAEHDPLARAFLVSLDPRLPELVMTRLVTEIEASPRRDVVGQALDRSAAILVRDEAAAARVVDELAPEHLQIVTSDPRGFLDQVRSYGAAFLGALTPVAFGDYGVGSNHVLPTMGTARFASGLRAADFVTVASLIEAGGEAIDRFGPEIERLSIAEGLPGHARTSEVRRT